MKGSGNNGWQPSIRQPSAGPYFPDGRDKAQGVHSPPHLSTKQHIFSSIYLSLSLSVSLLHSHSLITLSITALKYLTNVQIIKVLTESLWNLTELKVVSIIGTANLAGWSSVSKLVDQSVTWLETGLGIRLLAGDLIIQVAFYTSRTCAALLSGLQQSSPVGVACATAGVSGKSKASNSDQGRICGIKLRIEIIVRCLNTCT